MTRFEDVKDITIEEYFKGNAFSVNTFRDKYSCKKQDGTKETVAEVFWRVCSRIAEMEETEELKEYWSRRWFDEIWNDWWRPGGSIIAGTVDTKKVSTSNCFSADTEFITSTGTRAFSEYSDGDHVDVLTSDGGFRSATVRCFGKDKLYKVNLSRNGHHKYVYATGNHNWRVSGKDPVIQLVDTLSLLPGDKLPYIKRKWMPSANGSRYFCPLGLIHGLVFGDGYYNKNTDVCNLDLCGDSVGLVDLFQGFGWHIGKSSNTDRIRIYGLPNYMKRFPDVAVNEEYLLGFLIGWFTADGTVSNLGIAEISSARLENIFKFKHLGERVGIYTSTPRLLRDESPFTGDKTQKLYSAYIIKDCLFDSFFVKESHRLKYNTYKTNAKNISKHRSNWKVESVEETSRFEDVWCVDVPEVHEFVLSDGVGTHNCTTTSVNGDNLEEIFQTGFRLAKNCAYRQGIGIDLSPIRPRGTKINNSAEVSIGAVHWGKFYDNIANYVGQAGRIPAILLSLKVDHPDIEEFIKSKSDLHSVQNANISVQITDAFMEAVEKDKDWLLSYEVKDTGEKLEKTVKARDLMHLIAERACNFGEPGIQLIDTIQRDVNTSYVKDPTTGKNFVPISSNACSLAGDTEMLGTWGGQTGYRTIKELAETNNAMHELYNPATGSFHLCRVYKSGVADNLVELTIQEVDGDRNSKIKCTDNHVFLCDDGEQVQARDLCGRLLRSFSLVGQLLNSYSGTGGVKVINVDSLSASEDVYDFTMPEEVAPWPWGVANGVWTHNSEKLMYPDSTCVLASINVGRFSTAKSNKNLYQEICTIGESITRFLDNVVTYELRLNKSPIPEQKYVVEMLREIGVGITNLHGWLLNMGLCYDSDEAKEVTEKFVNKLAYVCYKTSIDLGKEKGNFGAFNGKDYRKSPYIKRLMGAFPDLKFKTMRNSMVLSIAPTGSLSLTFAKTPISTGIEPAPGFYYWKRSRTSGYWRWYFVVPTAVQEYLKDKYGLSFEWETIEDPDGKIGLATIDLIESRLGDFKNLFKPAHLIDPLKKVDLMAAVAKWIDSSISTTYNMPETATPELVEEIYKKAWKLGIKSVAVYRDKSRQGVIEFDPPPIVEKRFASKQKQERPATIERHFAPKRPAELPCDIYNVTVSGTKWVVIVGLLGKEPFEVFAGKSEDITIPNKFKSGIIRRRGKGTYDLVIPLDDDELVFRDIVNLFKNDTYTDTTRLISLCLRSGAHMQFVTEQLSKASNSITDFSAAVSRVLKKYSEEIVGREFKCPNCGGTEVDNSSGCNVCKSCGWSRCE